MEVPTECPVSTPPPVPLLIVATTVLLLLHVTPLVDDDSVLDAPTHTAGIPKITGSGLTVTLNTCLSAIQPLNPVTV